MISVKKISCLLFLVVFMSLSVQNDAKAFSINESIIKFFKKPDVKKAPALAPKAEKKKTEATEVKPEVKAPEKIEVTETGTTIKKSTEPLFLDGDIDESLPLPSYPANAILSFGKMSSYEMTDEDTLLDVARFFDLGYIEVLAANPGVDSWTPKPGEKVILPQFKLLPRTTQEGVVVNLAQMRLYYFDKTSKLQYSYPIGIGREGLNTPVGETTVINKVAGPRWNPTDRMREEKPWMPLSVAPGPSNPLGAYALYLGWPTFLIHGSNKPWAIGRRVSSGCMRMYPKNIENVFNTIAVGTKVTIVNQPILVAEIDKKLYLEVNPSRTQGDEIEIEGKYKVKHLTEGMKKVISDAAGAKAKEIKWDVVKKAVEERRGYPIQIN